MTSSLAEPQQQDLARLRRLLGELNDLKRIRTAGHPYSLAGQMFLRAWSSLIDGEPVEAVLQRETAAAVAGTQLSGITASVLTEVGLEREQCRVVLQQAVDVYRDSLPEVTNKQLSAGLGRLLQPDGRPHSDRVPEFAIRLAEQPRAGATRPGYARLILEPPESHAEHCLLVAVTAALVAPAMGAEPTAPFLAGLCHHLHNAYLPDGGFAGEELLGNHLEGILRICTERAFGELPGTVQETLRHCRGLLTHAETPEARAFHAADVIDRVLQMVHYHRVAAFTLKEALDELDLVHPGPLQPFQGEVLSAVGLWEGS